MYKECVKKECVINMKKKINKYVNVKKIFLCITIGTLVTIGGCGNTNRNKNNKDNSEVTSMEKETKEFITISQKEARKIMEEDEDVIILDVRTLEEYESGHIKDAILIPYDEVKEMARSVIPDRNSLVLVYCRSGSRSKIASQTLVKMGYTNVREFGGISSWEYETER